MKMIGINILAVVLMDLLFFSCVVQALRSPLLTRITKIKQSIKLRQVVGVGSSTLIAYHPSIAKATISTEAYEALQLLNGYESHTPYSVTWFILLAGGTYLLFEFYKFMASL